MHYAQFYHYGTTGELIEACGDRSVVVIDGRLNSATMGRIAAEECKKRGYVAWAMFAGESFTRSKRLNSPSYVGDQGKVDNTAMSASYGA